MSANAAIRHQRSRGELVLHVAHDGLKRLREQGAAKVRFPAGGHEAILINTGGGLAGGDQFAFDISAGENARLTVSSQAAERVYRSLGDDATLDVKLRADAGASLCWLPQETILFDGAALSRTITADLAASARFLVVEAIILGRGESGEVVRHARLHDRWRIRRNGRLIHAEDLALDGAPPVSKAALGGNRAFATIFLAADNAEALAAKIPNASAWNGKLVARLAAVDGFQLRKSLVPLLLALAGENALPKVWSL